MVGFLRCVLKWSERVRFSSLCLQGTHDLIVYNSVVVIVLMDSCDSIGCDTDPFAVS